MIFPLIQKQWFNLYLFNTNVFDFYSFLYYLSGIVCPLLVSFNSINKFTLYNFQNNHSIDKTLIKGKRLLLLVAIVIIPLIFFIIYYLLFCINLASELVYNKTFLFPLNTIQYTVIFFFLFTLLIFKKTRILIKKLILINFILISFMIWFSQINNILISHKIFITNYLNITNLNFFNIIYLFIIELMYYLWSYLSNNSNLSDWAVVKPLKNNIQSIYKICVFYLLIFVYYSILE